jgi:hypothetical protein
MPPLDRNVGLSRLSARVARQPSRRPRVGGGSRNAGAGRAGPRAGRRAPGHRPVRIITAETQIIRVSAGRGRARRLTWSVAPARHVL